MNPVPTPARAGRRSPSLPTRTSPFARSRHRKPATVLHSTFALEQISALARRCQAPEFVMLMAPVFGLDLPPPVYLRLQNALQQGQIPPVRCLIVPDGFYPAEYDSRQRTLHIHVDALAFVQDNPSSAWVLLEILLHEFGHYLDTLLREDLAPGGPWHRDAPGDEGTRYSRRMALAGWQGAAQVLLASYPGHDGQPVDIPIDPHQALRRLATRQAVPDTGAPRLGDPQREPFEASGDTDGQFSHESLERHLLTLGFSEAERQSVYFGNWLRDYSQLLDPRLVRGPGMAKDFPSLLSRQALTEAVDILAARRFAEARLNDPDSFRVTPERLGVYRPTEHIDNPRAASAAFDLAERDSDFEPWVLEGDPLLQVDFDTSMKRYIQRSVVYLQAQLHSAMQHGRTPEGLRHLGAALHVLEDFFAHSNFVELGLIKLGYPVLPWTSPADCRWKLPLVTGRFAGADVMASLAQPIANLIAPAESGSFSPARPGELSDTDRMLLVLLSEHKDPGLLKAYESWIDARDVLRENRLIELLRLKAWLQTAPLRLLSNAWNEAQRGLLTLLGSHVDDTQTLLTGDPNQNGSTDPSHSQLAKDHAEHPLHEPAGLLAAHAMTELAQAMLAHWNGQPDAHPQQLAAAFFCHANDSDWQDERLARWAQQHAPEIERASSAIALDTLREQIQDKARTALHNFEQESLSTWEYFKGLFEGLLGRLTAADEQPPTPPQA